MSTPPSPQGQTGPEGGRIASTWVCRADQLAVLAAFACFLTACAGRRPSSTATPPPVLCQRGGRGTASLLRPPSCWPWQTGWIDCLPASLQLHWPRLPMMTLARPLTGRSHAVNHFRL
ncbi:hypothetical protein BS50DRAFT_114686 [Corynespora cassiicola Philippines]|uniref:Uncharacterized protein n=1 Tax=Corynespora cassiicola Philippines TaxID=1448308 RepID=A0A2T2NDH9_CORCC|nr:hypothetical protein BS50DRAFT_114686 [Corynespora cassiicola Philippines]